MGEESQTQSVTEVLLDLKGDSATLGSLEEEKNLGAGSGAGSGAAMVDPCGNVGDLSSYWLNDRNDLHKPRPIIWPLRARRYVDNFD